MIVDNASSHKSKRVKDFLKRNKDVKIYYLPPYSPEYNPVEIIWRMLKATVVGARHIENGIQEILTRVRKLTRKWSLGIQALNVSPGIWSKIYD